MKVTLQLVERLLTIPEVCSSNPVIGKKLYTLNICLLSNVYWKHKNKEKEAGNGHVFEKMSSYFCCDQKCPLPGVLLLNFEARDFHNVVYRLVEEFGINDDLSSETKAEVLRTLLMPHKYVDGHTSNFTIGNFRRTLSKTSLRGSMRGFSGVSFGGKFWIGKKSHDDIFIVGGHRVNHRYII